MIHTRLCDILGIEYPIISGGMMWFSTPEFAAAASNAGILGTITAARCPDKEHLIEEIRRVKSLTDRPFAVNVSMLPEVQPHEVTVQFFEAIAEEKVPVIETAGRDPGDLFRIVKPAGVKIIHKVPAVRHAIRAEKGGADVVTIVGTECGGHPGMDNVGTIVLAAKAAESVSVPVIAGGGIADGRGLVAALALGAEGVCMGTRFMATTECDLHENFKNWMVSGSETDTMLIQRTFKNQARVRINPDAEKILELEAQGASIQDILPYVSGKLVMDSLAAGNLDRGTFPVGQAVGLIHDVKPIAEVVKDIMAQAEESLARLKQL